MLSACGQGNHDISYQENHEGTIVKIEKTAEEGPYNGWYYLLVISDVEDINILEKTDDELIQIAQDNDGAYYNVNPEMYEELDLEISTQIVLHYSGEGESDPPVRDAEKIDVVAK